MNQVASHLLEPTPTVLEIYGFTAEDTEKLRTTFNQCLQQPSYVSRLVIRSADQENRSRFVRSFKLACPLGLLLSFQAHHSDGFMVEELPHCCPNARLEAGKCNQCGEVPPHPLLPGLAMWPASDLLTEDDEDKRESNLDAFDRALVERLEWIEGVDSFSAFLMSQEIVGLVTDLARHNANSREKK